MGNIVIFQNPSLEGKIVIIPKTLICLRRRRLRERLPPVHGYCRHGAAAARLLLLTRGHYRCGSCLWTAHTTGRGYCQRTAIASAAVLARACLLPTRGCRLCMAYPRVAVVGARLPRRGAACATCARARPLPLPARGCRGSCLRLAITLLQAPRSQAV